MWVGSSFSPVREGIQHRTHTDTKQTRTSFVSEPVGLSVGSVAVATIPAGSLQTHTHPHTHTRSSDQRVHAQTQTRNDHAENNVYANLFRVTASCDMVGRALVVGCCCRRSLFCFRSPVPCGSPHLSHLGGRDTNSKSVTAASDWVPNQKSPNRLGEEDHSQKSYDIEFCFRCGPCWCSCLRTRRRILCAWPAAPQRGRGP